MTSGAGGDTALGVVLPHRVLRWGDRFEMVGIAAQAIPAQVIELSVLGYGADEVLVADSVGNSHRLSGSDPVSAVAVAGGGASPKPAGAHPVDHLGDANLAFPPR